MSFFGQLLFIYGLDQKSYSMCLISRLVFGVSDSLSIAQQCITCMLFPLDMLPVASAFIIFFGKIPRVINDNSASVVYNINKDVDTIFDIGLWVCAFSILSAVILWAMIGDQGTGRPTRGQQPAGSWGLQMLYKAEMLYLTLCIILVNCIIHSFYPNMSKFLQENFHYSNTEAGHLSSLSYIISMIVIPVLGYLMSFYKIDCYELNQVGQSIFLLVAHCTFIALRFRAGQDGQQQELVPASIVLIGLAQSLYCVTFAPITKKYCSNEEMPTFMSFLKITEGFTLCLALYFTGHLRQTCGSYTSVSLFLIALSATCLVIALCLLHATNAKHEELECSPKSPARPLSEEEQQLLTNTSMHSNK